MKHVFHKSESRGHFNYGWLDTRHTFSFARYYNPDRISFGALRVLNDDIVQPSEGFGKHPHDNMEIITIPITGSLLHRNSMGHEQVLHAGEVQVMSAGKGLFHEEYNGSPNSASNFLQLWIHPNKYHIAPRYDQRAFNPELAKNTWQSLVGPMGSESLNIYQNAYISRTFLSAGKSSEYKLNSSRNGCYLFIVEGNVRLGEIPLESRDGLALWDTNSFRIEAKTDAYIINMEIPMKSD